MWLESRGQSEELLVVGATLDGANELARGVAKERGVVFGWHRLSFSQLVFAIATPALAGRGLVPLSRVGTEAIVAGLVHRLKAASGLKHYDAVGAPRAIAGVIAELRSARVRSNAVESVAPDLLTIIQAYEREFSLVRRATSVWPAGAEPRRAIASGALRPLGFNALRGRALAGLWPAPERRFIASTRRLRMRHRTGSQYDRPRARVDCKDRHSKATAVPARRLQLAAICGSANLHPSGKNSLSAEPTTVRF
jgi:hypothetical protein